MNRWKVNAVAAIGSNQLQIAQPMSHLHHHKIEMEFYTLLWLQLASVLYYPITGNRQTFTIHTQSCTFPSFTHKHTYDAIACIFSFIMAADYWKDRFPGHSVVLDMSMTYISVAFATVLLNNLFLSLFSFKVRIMFGYAISLSTLVFVALCEVAWHMFSAPAAYSVNLVAVSLTAIGCTIQQSSFYGFASMFPKKYTQAVMAGESLAGLLVACTRISIKLLISSDEVSTVVFFLTSTIYITFSYVLHSTTIHSPFVRYHMKACSKIILRPVEDHHRVLVVSGLNRKTYFFPLQFHTQTHKYLCFFN